jgi:ornithine cyclodeaminase
MTVNFSVISGAQVAEVIKANAPQVQDIIKKAYLLHHEQQTINPNSYFLRYPQKPHARIIALPAHIGSDINVSGIKWIASNPENIKQGLPRASAVLILNDGDTGYPFACLEASIISATRTAASAVLAAEYLRSQNKKQVRLGIIGAGLISRYIYQTLMNNGWELDHILIYDLNEDYSSQFLKHIDKNKHSTAHVADSAETLIQSSDLVLFATSAIQPTISEASWFANNPIVLNVSLRDLAPEVLINANNVVDDVEHVLSANTSPHLTAQKYPDHQFINGTLAGYIKQEFQLDPSKPCIFSPMGMGILDLALGNFIYDYLHAKNQLTIIDDFFVDVAR